MAKRHWLEAIQQRLSTEGLPPAYIRRLTDELADHFDDVKEDGMNEAAETISRLGEADQLADAAIAAYRRQTFFGRHPSAKFLVFGVSPLIAMFLVFVLACLGVAAVGAMAEWCGVRLFGKDWFGRIDSTILNWVFAAVTAIGPATLVALFYCRAAARLALRKGWMLASCVVVGFVAMLPFHRVVLSELPGKSIWTIGLGLPPTMVQYVQLLIPLAVGLWFVCSGRKRSISDGRLPTAD
ncbi:MAG: hypothetical protein ABFC54_05760 [Thermoguttaceae bacterium]